MKDKTKFQSLRLKPETLDRLRDMKLAFEVSYCKPIYNDDFIQKLIDAVEEGEPSVWDNYCRIQLKKEISL